MDFFTIGVYNSTEVQFFDKLISNHIDTFCDIRQRRGVRGSKYAFVNSQRLQQRLEEFQIKYLYVQGLAPGTEIRELQKQVDVEKGELKSQRQDLGEVFITEYKNRVVGQFDFEYFFETLENIGATKIAFFCVEQRSNACHRSIVGDELALRYNYNITNL